MIDLEKNQFEKLIQEDRLNIVVFYRSECEVCDMLFEDFKKRNINNYYKANINKDIIYYKTQLGIWTLPMTKIYLKGIVLWERGGILYDKQIKELFLVLNEGRLE